MYWDVLARPGTYWHVLTSTGTYWHVLTRTDTYWRVLTRTDTYWQVLKSVMVYFTYSEILRFRDYFWKSCYCAKFLSKQTFPATRASKYEAGNSLQRRILWSNNFEAQSLNEICWKRQIFNAKTDKKQFLKSNNSDPQWLVQNRFSFYSNFLLWQIFVKNRGLYMNQHTIKSK